MTSTRGKSEEAKAAIASGALSQRATSGPQGRRNRGCVRR